MPKTKRISANKAALALGAWVAYILAFIPLYRLVGTPVAALGILPVVAIGWLFGTWAGLLASLLAFSLNVLLATLAGGAGWDVMIRGGLPGSILLVLIGAAVGRLRDMGERVKQELARRKRAEEELGEHHQYLEELVQQRTAELTTANEQLQREIAERGRAEAELEVYAHQQATLFQLSADLATTLDEADVCQEVVRGLHETLGYHCRALFLVDETTGDRVLGASAGLPDAPPNWHIPPGHGLSERPLLDGQLHYTPDVTRDPSYIPGLDSGSEVDVPLRVGEKMLGVLMVESREPDAFDEGDFAALTAAANQASLALERAREHQAVKEAEARYRGLFDGVPVGLYRSTPEGQFLDANPALVQMLGYPDMETLLAANAVAAYADPEDRKRWQTLVEREGIVRDFEVRLRQRDGTAIWMRESTHAARDADGRVLQYEGTLEDITERKRAEEALRESEEKYRTNFESIEDGYYEVDLAGNLTFFNNSLCRLYRYPKDELMGMNYRQYMDDETAKTVYQAFNAVYRTGEPARAFNWGVIRKDGTRGSIEVSVSPISGPTGEPAGFRGTVRDVTERKRAEEQLQRRAAQAALVYEIGQRVSRELDPGALLSEIVTAVCDTFDYYGVMLLLLDEEAGYLTLQSIAGGYVDAFPEDLRLAIGEGMIGHAAATGETQISGDVSKDPHYVRKAEEETESELAVPIKSGHKVIGVLDLQSDEFDAFDESDVMLMETLADQIAAAIENARLYESVQQELAERKRAEEQLQRRAAQAALVYEIGQRAGRELDPGALLSEIVTAVCDAFDYHSVMLELVDEEAKCLAVQSVAGAYADFFPNQHMAIGEGMTGYAAATGETQVSGDVSQDPRYVPDVEETKSELAVPIKSGQKVIGVLDLQSDEFDAFDEADVMVIETLADQIAVAIENAQLYEAVQQELAERKRAEEQLQRYAAELEQANEEVRQFAYIVSHDLRAPLVNLKGFAAELRAALAVIGSATITALPHMDEKLQETVTTALQEDVPEALGFIDSSATRMDRFINAVLKLSRLGRRELHPELIDMDALVQANLQTLAYQVEQHRVNVTVGPLPEVVADRTSMEQVLGNLLTNAVIYLDAGRPGEIEVGAGERNQVIKKEPGFTTFWVRDNGRGIAEEDMDKVFAPFRRAGKQDVPGEGMGLAYVQTLVRRHGGRIWCESELGVGTTFTFTIPDTTTS